VYAYIALYYFLLHYEMKCILKMKFHEDTEVKRDDRMLWHQF